MTSAIAAAAILISIQHSVGAIVLPNGIKGISQKGFEFNIEIIQISLHWCISISEIHMEFEGFTNDTSGIEFSIITSHHSAKIRLVTQLRFSLLAS